jgi:ankyrin repeat protein
MIRTTVYILSIILLAAALGGCGKKRHELKSHAGQVNLELFIAARIENAQEAQRALILGADLEGLDRNGLTPLLAAAYNDSSRIDVSALLIEKGAELEARDSGGKTALLVAIEKDKSALAKLLIEKGADINVRDKRNQSPLYLSIKKDREDLVALLLEKGVDQSAQIQLPLITATFNNNLNIVKMLLDKGADVNASGDEGWTALHASASGNFYRIASLLLEKGADPLIKDARGQLPTFYASRQVLNLLKSAEEKAEEKGK